LVYSNYRQEDVGFVQSFSFALNQRVYHICRVRDVREMMPDNNPVNDQRISLFLRKLWTLVCSEETDNVITWNEVTLHILFYFSKLFLGIEKLVILLQ